MPDYTQPAEDVFLDDALNQRAVYWHPKKAGNEGQKRFEAPVEVVCHWQQATESFLDRRSGNPEMSRAKVIVDRDLKELGVLWLPPDSGVELEAGQALSQLTSQTLPFSNDGAYEIRRFDKIPNYDGDEFARFAYL